MNCMKEPEILTIDAHCHLFNHEVLSWRLLVDFILSRMRPRGTRARLETAGGISELKRIIRFFKTGLMDTENIYGKLLAEGGCNTVVPLMFDLDYCMKGAGCSDGLRRRKGYKKNVKKAARKEWAALRKELDELASRAGKGERRELGEMKQALRRLSRKTERLSLGKRDAFRTQEEELLKLAAAHPGKVLPFYVVDPRRPGNCVHGPDGTIDVSPLTDRLVPRLGGKGGFYGFKLYCPNGYSPTDPALMALYEYCERHGAPLTAHCSGGGFASFSPSIAVHGHVYRNGEVVPHDGVLEFRHYRLTDKLRVKEKAELLNHPRLWEKVMEAFPRLRLNLAHFGCQDEGTEWTELIYGMMEKFPGLHTDLSCITEASRLREMREYFLRAPEQVRRKFLFGSDFYLNLLFLDGMKEYMENFRNTFTEQERRELMTANPSDFLGLS
ncbi:hypothetical protein CXU22_00765 [Akkermansia muciniphila]|uniref:Amidohydrolase-related domain-containing protein n=1 Tax=Akkermansia muciniphila TaxID=239935 RepID=A0A2N8HGY9_9BACT|nr:amidohydrolase family protein [Akkermansia muciniphila]PNC20346.1 hypothetical protein CXU22_00765 [Akkermansia muciniphila]